jgi:hypothetical protein
MVDDEDYDWISKYHWHVYRRKHTFYAQRLTLDRKWVSMHREILGITDPKILSDHIDHNGLNNQRSNLRLSNSSQNNSNRRSSTGKSKFKGVCWNEKRKKWRAYICVNKVRSDIGCFDSEEDAAKAYNQKAVELHGEFAFLNKVA